MKKIGIITLHFYDNFGSVIQAYALKTAIEKIGEYEAEIINYIPNLEQFCYFTDPGLLEKYEEKKGKFKKFRKEKMEIQDKILDRSELNDDSYDCLITGSDQIWNLDITKGDTSYFLDFVKDKKRIAYAASMAIESTDDKTEVHAFREHLPKFSAISVREKSLRSFVAQYAQCDVCSVLDPAMLLSAEDYEPVISMPKNAEELRTTPFLFMYFLTHDSTVIDYAIMISKALGLRIVHCFAGFPASVFPEDALDMTFEGPAEFLWYIKNAALVFTNSFHGTALSIVFGKNFYTYTGKRRMLSRVLDLTEDFKLESRRFEGYGDLKKILYGDIPIEYAKVNELLYNSRRKSLEFLKNAY